MLPFGFMCYIIVRQKTCRETGGKNAYPACVFFGKAVDKMYEMKSRVRYSEVGADRKLTLISLIDYLQDCATFHSEDLGLGLDYLEEKNMAWVLVSWQIIVDRYPELGEDITVQTWAYGFRSFYADRNLVIRGPHDEILARANSLWLLINLDTGHPMKALPEQVEKYGTGPKLDMEYAPRKIKQPDTFENIEPVEVYRHMIDTNGHMNNGQYVLIAREMLPQGFSVRQVRTEYKNAAVLGDMLYPKLGRLDDAYVIRLDNADGKTFAVVEFRQADQI